MDGCSLTTMRSLRLTIIWLVICAALVPSGAAAAQARSILVMDQPDLRGPFYYRVFSSMRTVVNADRGPPIGVLVEVGARALLPVSQVGVEASR